MRVSVRTKLWNMVYIVKGVDVWALSFFLPYLLEWWARLNGFMATLLLFVGSFQNVFLEKVQTTPIVLLA